MPKYTDDSEFIEAWRRFKKAKLVAKHFKMDVRSVYDTELFLVYKCAVTALRVRVTFHAVPLAVLNLNGDIIVPLFHGLDSTCLSSVLARVFKF